MSVSNEGAMVWRCYPPYHVGGQALDLGDWSVTWLRAHDQEG